MADGSALNTGFPPFLATAPIFISSTHGQYDLDDPLMSGPFIVPENTILIETGDISESCYFRTWYNAVEPLLVNRPKLVTYLKGIPDPSDDPKKQRQYMEALRIIHFYEPGAKVYNRELFMIGGRDETTHNSIRVEFKLMKFSRINLEGQVQEILKLRKDELYTVSGAEDTYETMMQRFIEASPDVTERIIIFSCCGVIETSGPGKTVQVNRKIQEVQEAQRAADLIFMTKHEEYLNANVNANDHPYVSDENANALERRVRNKSKQKVPSRGIQVFEKMANGSMKQIFTEGRPQFTKDELAKFMRGKSKTKYVRLKGANFVQLGGTKTRKKRSTEK